VIERRVADYERIDKTLPLRLDASKEERATERADAAIVFGDFNYRVNCTVGMMKYLLDQELFEVAMMNDQLMQLKKTGKVMGNLQEGKIEFAPTYRFIPGTDNYCMETGHIPSYTDRIMHRSKEESTLRLVSYDSNNLIKLSDHRPVFAQFLCRFKADIPSNMISKDQAITEISKKECMFGQTNSATCTII